MSKISAPTKYASAERVTANQLQKQSLVFSENQLLINIVESLSQMLVVLNKQRQIVYANQLYLKYCGVSKSESLIGMRPGESINCIHAFSTEGGCGTTEFCTSCGAVNAILESHKGAPSTKECRILTGNKDAADIQVTATPYSIDGEMFTIFTIIDIGSKKRRETLERVFFHDILNSAGGISGLSAVLTEIKDPKEITNIAAIINRAAENLVDEIQLQRQLGAAERGELIPDIVTTNSLSILNDIKDLYERHKLSTNKTIALTSDSENIDFETDPTLLRRVLGNMLKNALEVNHPLTVVTLKCVAKNNSVLFSVHNNSYIKKSVQLQLFKRSYSTKGEGRGLGTYSMKLFGEKYLKGKVWFESTEENGTTFYFEV